MAGTEARTRLTIATPIRLSIPSEDGRLKATFNVDASARSEGVHAAQVTFRIRRGSDEAPADLNRLFVLMNGKIIKVMGHMDGYVPQREHWETHHVSFLANKTAVLHGAADGPNKLTFELASTEQPGSEEKVATNGRFFDIEDVTLLFHAKSN